MEAAEGEAGPCLQRAEAADFEREAEAADFGEEAGAENSGRKIADWNYCFVNWFR